MNDPKWTQFCSILQRPSLRYPTLSCSLSSRMFWEIPSSAIGSVLLLRVDSNMCYTKKETPSEVLNVCSGVPQGSVLGLLLFLIFINDVVDERDVKIRLYADDSVIYSRSDQLKLNTELDKITQWCKTWQMSVNYKKCATLSVTNKKHPLLFKYTANDMQYHVLKSSNTLVFLYPRTCVGISTSIAHPVKQCLNSTI